MGVLIPAPAGVAGVISVDPYEFNFRKQCREIVELRLKKGELKFSYQVGSLIHFHHHQLTLPVLPLEFRVTEIFDDQKAKSFEPLIRRFEPSLLGERDHDSVRRRLQDRYDDDQIERYGVVAIQLEFIRELQKSK